MIQNKTNSKTEKRIQMTAKSWQKINPTCSTIVEDPLQIGPFMQNKANVKIGKMSISIAIIKDYGKNNEQSTTNVIQNKAKQSQLLKSSNDGLSFLRKQESTFRDGPGFRIKCGMTGRIKHNYSAMALFR